MKAVIEAFAAPAGGVSVYAAAYERGDFPRAARVKDLQTRFCFDMLSAAGLTPWVCGTLYGYADDTHILTALESILPAVTRKY